MLSSLLYFCERNVVFQSLVYLISPFIRKWCSRLETNSRYISYPKSG